MYNKVFFGAFLNVTVFSLTPPLAVTAGNHGTARNSLGSVVEFFTIVARAGRVNLGTWLSIFLELTPSKREINSVHFV